MHIAVIGGGAAGFFSALAVKENYPQASVTIFEKSSKLLAKVKVSGGGRCNVTNGTTSISELCSAYPRGGKRLKKIFQVFSTVDTMNWFDKRGVQLVTQDDNRVFPKSNNSQTIIDCFLKEADRLNVEISLKTPIQGIKLAKSQVELTFQGSEREPQLFDKVILATGGSPKRSGLEWLEELGHKIEEPVPSLFTFNMPEEPITKLMGVVVENAIVSIQGSKLRSEGPLLITHWGMSGPAILKLSAFGARMLNDLDYKFKIQVNWVNEINNEVVYDELLAIRDTHSKKILSTIRPYALPERMWQFLLKKSNLMPEKRWADLGKKQLNKLVAVLTNDLYEVKGKTTFKEEFVTCGGVSLDSIVLKTMQSNVCENLYFAGEVMNIDAITGGYNFQAAWTTGFIAGKLG